MWSDAAWERRRATDDGEEDCFQSDPDGRRALLSLNRQRGQSRGSHAALRCVDNTSAHPVPGRTAFNFGNARIAVDLPKGATFIAVPDGRSGQAFIQKDGWIRTKVGWFTPHDTPRVTGRRTNRTGRHLRADVGARSYA